MKRLTSFVSLDSQLPKKLHGRDKAWTACRQILAVVEDKHLLIVTS